MKCQETQDLPCSPRQIEDYLSRLGCGVERVEGLLNIMEQRLSSVMRDEVTASVDADVIPAQCQLVPMAFLLNRVGENITKIEDRIKLILYKLEL